MNGGVAASVGNGRSCKKRLHGVHGPILHENRISRPQEGPRCFSEVRLSLLARVYTLSSTAIATITIEANNMATTNRCHKIAAFLLAVSTATVNAAQSTGTCALLQTKAQKPFPSLAQCYKYNAAACCMAGHDADIETKWHTLLPTNCLREFSDLEFFFCAGCSPQQPDFTSKCTVGTDCKLVDRLQTDTTLTGNKMSLFQGTCGADDVCSAGVMRVCQSFADKLFDPEDTTLYDKCGLNMPITKFVPTGTYDSTYPADSYKRWWHKTGEKDALSPRFYNITKDGTTSIVLPSKVFLNAEELMNVMKPPFFDEYFIEVVNPADEDECFSAAPGRGALLPSLAATAVAVVAAVFVLLGE